MAATVLADVPAEGPNLFADGDLEEHEGDRFPRWAFHDEPGKVNFARRLWTQSAPAADAPSPNVSADC